MEKSTLLKIGLVAVLFGLYAASRSNFERAEAPPAAQAPAPAPQDAAPSGGPVVPNATKLQITDVSVGKGATAVKGKTVSVHYRGTLTNGTEFDQSYKRGQPFDFPLGGGQVIKGWDQGVAGMKVGGKRRLVIPPDLGYGANGQPPTIPPDATLIFEVELLKVT